LGGVNPEARSILIPNSGESALPLPTLALHSPEISALSEHKRNEKNGGQPYPHEEWNTH
jgi:hypothetical protein